MAADGAVSFCAVCSAASEDEVREGVCDDCRSCESSEWCGIRECDDVAKECADVPVSPTLSVTRESRSEASANVGCCGPQPTGTEGKSAPSEPRKNASAVDAANPCAPFCTEECADKAFAEERVRGRNDGVGESATVMR